MSKKANHETREEGTALDALASAPEQFLTAEELAELQDDALQSRVTAATTIPDSVGISTTSCSACGSSAYPFGHPQGLYACGRCGTIQRPGADIAGAWRVVVDEAESGDAIDIRGPFRACRDIDTMRAVTVDGEYLFEWGGAVLLMASLGCVLTERRDDGSLAFVKS